MFEWSWPWVAVFVGLVFVGVLVEGAFNYVIDRLIEAEKHSRYRRFIRLIVFVVMLAMFSVGAYFVAKRWPDTLEGLSAVLPWLD